MHYIGLYTDNLLFVSPDLDDIRRIKDGLKREYGKDLGETKFSACGGEPKTREHFLPHCPLYASQRATLLSSLQLRSPALAYLLSDRMRQRQCSVSSPTGAPSTRFIARPRRICLVEFPHS